MSEVRQASPHKENAEKCGHEIICLDLDDSEYRRLLDSLARFHNSQMTAHVGYLLTSALGYLALSSLAAQSGLIRWFGLAVSLLILAGVGAIYFVAPISVLPIFPRYLLARTQYYIVLSQVVWDHMGITSPSKEFFDLLKNRALRLGIQTAVRSMFEARLYLSFHKEGQTGNGWERIFYVADFMRKFNVSSYRETKLFGIFDMSSLLLMAHRRTLAGYLKKPETNEYKIGELFKELGLIDC